MQDHAKRPGKVPTNPEALTDRRCTQLGRPPAYVSGFATADTALNALRTEVAALGGLLNDPPPEPKPTNP